MNANWWFRQLTVVFVAAAVVVQFGSVEGNYITVGGTQHGWSPDVNYTLWTAQQPAFHIGDWLMFRFNKYMYDVLEVNQTSYEQCNPQGFIRNVTRGGRDVLELNETRTYYFICSKGYCFGGMKVAITVVEQQLPPAPSPDQNDGQHRNVMSLMLGFLVALVWIFAI